MLDVGLIRSMGGVFFFLGGFFWCSSRRPMRAEEPIASRRRGRRIQTVAFLASRTRRDAGL